MTKIFSFTVVWIGLSQSAAFACSCVGGSPNDHLELVDVVFAGKAIAEEKGGWRTSGIGFEWRPPFIYLTEALHRKLTTFEVTSVWKGKVFAKTSVAGGGPCEYRFRQGEEYIVYAYWFKGELRTGLRLRNRELRNASEDLAAFGAGKPPAPNPSSAHNYIGKLIAVFLLLSVIGLAGWQGWRKYGVQRS